MSKVIAFELPTTDPFAYVELDCGHSFTAEWAGAPALEVGTELDCDQCAEGQDVDRSNGC